MSPRDPAAKITILLTLPSYQASLRGSSRGSSTGSSSGT